MSTIACVDPTCLNVDPTCVNIRSIFERVDPALTHVRSTTGQLLHVVELWLIQHRLIKIQLFSSSELHRVLSGPRGMLGLQLSGIV